MAKKASDANNRWREAWAKAPTNDELPELVPALRRELFDTIREFGGVCGAHCLDHLKPMMGDYNAEADTDSKGHQEAQARHQE